MLKQVQVTGSPCDRRESGGGGPVIRVAGPAALSADRSGDPPWNAHHMAGTGEMAARRDDLFRAVTGNNLGISRAFFEEAGSFDESFELYGGEDTEFGYRVITPSSKKGAIMPRKVNPATKVEVCHCDRRRHRLTLAALTPNRAAATRWLAPAATTAKTRTRRSKKSAFDISAGLLPRKIV